MLGTTPGATDARFAKVDRYLADGEVDQAETLLKQILADPNHEIAAHATFVLGRTYLSKGDTSSAQTTLNQYVSANPTGPDTAAAEFALARLSDQKGASADAAKHYRRYLDLTKDHALDGYADYTLAEIARSTGDTSTAVKLYRQAITAGIPTSLEFQAAGYVASKLGRPADVEAWYASLSDRPGLDPTTRMHYVLLQADLLKQAGQASQVQALYQKILTISASAATTNAAISTLTSVNQSSANFALGEAYLASGQYEQAVAFLGDYLDRNPAGANAATARYDRGVALMKSDAFAGAAAQFDSFVTKHPTDKRVGQAILLEGQCLSQAGQPVDAATLLQAYAQQHPSDPVAPQALSNAIDALEQAKDTAGATALAQQLESLYPTSPYAARAAFIEGWADYEKLDFVGAASIWQTVLKYAPTNPASAPALLWLGKLQQKAGNLTAAEQLFTLAWKADPGDYYAFRARDLANNTPPSNVYALSVPSPEELARERSDFEAWLADWTKMSASDRSRPYLGAAIAQTSILNRIRALAEAGLSTDVQNEYQQAFNAYNNDPRSLYALADVMNQIGWTPQSLNAAYQLLMISPAPNAFQSPVFLQRLVYPFPYQDLIESASQKDGIDPLLLVSLIRQESMFNTHAHSSANAIGLTQFVPSTAQDLATSLGMTSFTLSDLYYPSVSIQLGAAYLSSQIKAFGGNPFLALAAYNAGAGNVDSWLSDNPRHDLDLFVQEIPFSETREYVQNIYRFYAEYQFLYRSPSPSVGEGG